MILQQLKVFLDSHKVKYTVVTHSPAYTSLEIAALARIPGKEIAKTVIVDADSKRLMVVLPASHMVDFTLLREFTGARHVELTNEQQFKSLFPECEIGAMPPFGNLFDMKVYVSESLAEDEMIAFNAGTHKELVKMPYRDFVQLVQPHIGALSHPKRHAFAREAWDMP